MKIHGLAVMDLFRFRFQKVSLKLPLSRELYVQCICTYAYDVYIFLLASISSLIFMG